MEINLKAIDVSLVETFYTDGRVRRHCSRLYMAMPHVLIHFSIRECDRRRYRPKIATYRGLKLPPIRTRSIIQCRTVCKHRSIYYVKDRKFRRVKVLDNQLPLASGEI